MTTMTTTLRSTLFAMTLAAAAGLAGCHRAPPVTGDFTGIALPQHSIHVAHLDVYLHFTWQPSHAWYAQEAEWAKPFGRHIEIKHHFVLAPGESDAPMRLYLLAKAAGKGDEVADTLMRSPFAASDPDETLVATAYLASRFGLRKEFDDSTDDPAMREQLAAVGQTQQQLQFEPTLILNKQMMFAGDAKNASEIVASALTSTR